MQDMSGTELQIGASYVGIHIRAANDQPSIYFRHLLPTSITLHSILYITHSLLTYIPSCAFTLLVVP